MKYTYRLHRPFEINHVYVPLRALFTFASCSVLWYPWTAISKNTIHCALLVFFLTDVSSHSIFNILLDSYSSHNNQHYLMTEIPPHSLLYRLETILLFFVSSERNTCITCSVMFWPQDGSIGQP